MKILIIGGDAAGMSAAMQIVRNSSGHEITVLEKGGVYSYGQCGLPYVISGKIESTDRLIARTPSTFKKKYGIDARVFHEAQNVDIENKMVSGINHSNGDTFSLPYDRLLIATGVSSVIPEWEGVTLPGIFSLKTIPDAKAIMDYLEKDINNVTVIGGGYIGLEMAESFAELGKKVTIIERNEQLAKIFDTDMAELIHEEAVKQNIVLKMGESVEAFGGSDHVESVKTDKGEYETDLVLVAVGVKPNTSFLERTGIKTSVNGAIQINAYMQTSIEDIYAAGDCATQYHRVKEKDDHVPLGTHANKQGQIAGLNMVDVHKTFKGIVGTSIIKFFDLTLGRTGLSEKEANMLNIPCGSVTITATDIAGYYPDDEKMKLKLVYHKETLKVLGGQIIGGNGVDKRIDVLATAIFHSMTTDELLDLDLAYAPPYNGVWDPVQQAARRVK
ncbi:CoA-disulfide reductase [Mesobacillus selenatarsenatis]|uniref:Pyridine nucleotide-disulfide oxidoreductase/NADH dehydrogenase n=1 Tax=Mesobacillus selenatarsenatis (strain DSM 18680 / JCM 14380 / FERM P-15431 / SF-1) TaxID=1321606 RepID=A0A0A8X556_MESS1|nr:CoA-disulfide reductase [Mesobacillus selenatarsenatis]GAM13266.1 pyridine nucleotide-disulfide oxidoreductase/NADH dehydrogenase [Mesobacillus selenatarsenatis SF-1]